MSSDFKTASQEKFSRIMAPVGTRGFRESRTERMDEAHRCVVPKLFGKADTRKVYREPYGSPW